MDGNALMESDVEDLLCAYPQLVSEGMTFVEKREALLDAGIIDLVFKDENCKKVLVEVKRGEASRRDVGQVIEYLGVLKHEERDAKIILVAEEIKPSFKVALNLLGVECREFADVKKAAFEGSKLEEEAKLYKMRAQYEASTVSWALDRLKDVIEHAEKQGYCNCRKGVVPLMVLQRFRDQLRWSRSEMPERLARIRLD